MLILHKNIYESCGDVKEYFFLCFGDWIFETGSVSCPRNLIEKYNICVLADYRK